MRKRLLIPVLAVVLLASCGGTASQDQATASNSKYTTFASDVTLRDPLDPVAVIDTDKGMIAMEVFEAKAPKTANNFMQLVTKGFYDGLRFHLVEPGFAVQTGDPTGTGTGGANIPGVPLEIHPDLHHDHAGVVGMAHVDTDVNSATSQFYILLAPQPSLDGKFAVFADVVKGMDVVQQIVRGDQINRIVLVRLSATK